MTTRWPEPCQCHPGSEAGGWHEIRCEACRAVETAIWWDMIRRMREHYDNHDAVTGEPIQTRRS